MATHFVRQTQWNAEVAQSGHYDKIIVQNLEVVVNAGKDVWGRQKKQRALISVTLTLGERFISASSTDSVDQSTVHYGTLSKAIQATLQGDSAWQSTAALSDSISQSVRKVAGSTKIYALETDVCYLKGSMFGDGAGHMTSTIEDSGVRSSVLYLRNVRIPCIIGVNSNERLQKQPVVVNVWLENVPDDRVDDHAKLETLVFQLISDSSFQTIESLLAWLVEQLRQKLFTREEDQDAWVRLRIEKPLAVPFADAPAVEITRPVRSSQQL
ncbi:Dihydroneopterin aldolase-domain-containing protein [Pyrenochaeta sp. MPI-SDFR-AT-0127]|nr:Dihydroneopterin aldolase-domain-containing protein [Pyrenochaeta sp. MPI-SDFR-AT-0127]